MKKIMFNTKLGLEQAVLEGRKTQTRRMVQDEFFTLQWDISGDTLVVENEWGDFIDIRNTKYCMFKVGEIVAIAQRYKDISSCGFPVDSRYDLFRKEDWDEDKRQYGKLITHKGWRNKMFVKPELMPHKIRITKVRIEKLQDISWEDCLAEGLIADIDPMNPICNIFSFEGANQWYFHPREAYASLIDKVGKKGDWESNPYVFVYDFELVK